MPRHRRTSPWSPGRNQNWCRYQPPGNAHSAGDAANTDRASESTAQARRSHCGGTTRRLPPAPSGALLAPGGTTPPSPPGALLAPGGTTPPSPPGALLAPGGTTPPSPPGPLLAPGGTTPPRPPRPL